jgi:hypothetical protein
VQIGKLHFRFECQPGCTNCCTQDGHVYLTAEDIRRIAPYVGMNEGQFEKNYVLLDGEHRRLKMEVGERCFFLEEGGCGIHPVKPLQCRVFPYWPENVGSRRAWHGLRRFCPGVGAGRLIQIEEVRREAEGYRSAFPDL